MNPVTLISPGSHSSSHPNLNNLRPHSSQEKAVGVGVGGWGGWAGNGFLCVYESNVSAGVTGAGNFPTEYLP